MKYNPLLTVEVHPIKLKTNKGPIIFNLWDTCANEKFGPVRDGFFVNSDAVILMFDLSSRESYINLSSWYKDILRICKSVPVVLVGTKVEERKIKSKQVTFHKKKNLPYFEISSKGNYNIELPYIIWRFTIDCGRSNGNFQNSIG
jgi:GTP-binding nuclear protein Ran